MFNEGMLKNAVEITDSISNECQAVADALADYESASELSGQERTDARSDARDAAYSAIGDLLAEAKRLAELAGKLEEVLA